LRLFERLFVFERYPETKKQGSSRNKEMAQKKV
jgi:hypothetical protein